MIISKYFRIDGKDYVEASDYDKILYELKHANDKIAELESELSAKDSLLKIKNGLCGEKTDYEKAMEEILSYEPTDKEDDVARFNYDSLVAFANAAKKKNRIVELEFIHQSDCITINRLHTALDVMTEKYQRLREMINFEE